MKSLQLAFTSLLLLTAACGKKAGGDSDGGDLGTGIAADPAAVNALVPAAFKDKLVFEKQDIATDLGRTKTTFTLAFPKGWKRSSEMFANFDAPSDAGLGFGSQMKVSSNCGGECKPKDWNKVVDEYFQSVTTGNKVVKDVKGKTSRLFVSESTGGMGPATDVVYAWWTDGGKESYLCSAKIATEGKDTVPAFEKACQAVAVTITKTPR
jgi:hypothetical protein